MNSFQFTCLLSLGIMLVFTGAPVLLYVHLPSTTGSPETITKMTQELEQGVAAAEIYCSYSLCHCHTSAVPRMW